MASTMWQSLNLPADITLAGRWTSSCSASLPPMSRTTSVVVTTAGCAVVVGLLWKHVLRRRFFAVVVGRVAGPELNRRMADRKRKLFAGMTELMEARGDGRLVVVDIGCGAGSNFCFYPPGTEVIGVDVNRHVESYIRSGVDDWPPGVRLTEFHVASAEKLNEVVDAEVADAAVVSGLLCAVKDVDGVLREVKRVIRPGGKVFFMEHILSPPAYPYTRLLQQIINPLFSFIMDGCSLNRTTDVNIQSAGFSQVDIDQFEAYELTEPTSVFVFARLTRTFIMGTATK